MKSTVPNIPTTAFYTVREAAWILGVNPSTVCRAIRTGALPAIRRRSRLVVAAHVLARLLDGPANVPSPNIDRLGGGAP